MKKSKFIALVLVVSVMLMGAGYAAWTETLTIEHTVVTGNVDIDLADGTINVFQDAVTENTDGLVRIATVVGSEQAATVNLTNLYPSAKIIATIPVTNNGTIPVDFKEISTNGIPDWLTVTSVCPAYLAVDADDNIVVTMTVTNAAPESSSATFTLTPIYSQWNAQ
ncbi:MAG: hypothetical protein WBL93_12680 [Lutisporaceae bacterium]